ncbi:MAG: hypothetical protein JEZ09_13335 [Salinivirgaceae bacterium]|nr:hypothetical protein [Salinivirgaceae bacterium]
MKIKSILLILSLLAVFSSCKKDNEDEPIIKNGNILVSTMLSNPDGMSGSAYMQLMENIEPKALTNTAAIPVCYGTPPCVCDNDVFVIPGFGNEIDKMTKYTRVNGELVKQGEYTLPTQSWATNVVTKGDVVYVSCPGIGKILVINHKSMSLIKEIDITSYGVGDQNPDPGSMLIRDNLLFVGLTQSVGGYYPAPERPYADVLIVDTDNNELVKMITDSIAGVSYPTRVMDPNSIFMDENNDIYVVCLGGFGALHTSGVLRIKAGETEFDNSYQFVFNTTSITGEANTCDYIHTVNYFGNGKMYGIADIPAYYCNPVNYLEDRACLPVEIDLNAKTIKAIGLPLSNAYGLSVGIIEGIVVFGLATETSNGFYTYDPTTETASPSAVITTTGYPYSFVSFE